MRPSSGRVVSWNLAASARPFSLTKPWAAAELPAEKNARQALLVPCEPVLIGGGGLRGQPGRAVSMDAGRSMSGK